MVEVDNILKELRELKTVTAEAHFLDKTSNPPANTDVFPAELHVGILVINLKKSPWGHLVTISLFEEHGKVLV